VQFVLHYTKGGGSSTHCLINDLTSKAQNLSNPRVKTTKFFRRRKRSDHKWW